MIKIEIIGAAEMREAMKELTAGQLRRHAMKSVAESLRPAAEKARALAPSETGTLKRSIGISVKTRKGKIVGRVGPRSGYGRINSAGKYTPAGKYGNIVEFGRAKEGGGTVAAKPFMRPAFAATQQSCMAILGADIGARIVASVSKKAKRRKRSK